jgi:DNA-binding CsgD family transcriptional regulator
MNAQLIPISNREKTILELMCDNNNSQEIANRLFLSIRTIETYRRRLLVKFDAKNSATLIKRVIDYGLFN